MSTDVKQLLETMPEAPEAWVDATIGRYVFRRLVGTGGMGIVVAAYDPETGKRIGHTLHGMLSGVFFFMRHFDILIQKIVDIILREIR